MRKNEKKTSARPAALHLALPATSANLGPAFDAAALAMDLYISVDARPAPSFSIAATGRDHEICQRLENHLILTTYSEILEAQGAEVTPLSLRIKNDIPITSAVCDGPMRKSSEKLPAESTILITHPPAGWAV